MIRFYISYISEAIKLLFAGWTIVFTVLGMSSAVAISINQTVVKNYMENVEGISPLYAFIPAGLVVLYGLLRANYNRFKKIEQERDAMLGNANKVVLSNREVLARAIADVARAAVELLIRKREINQSKEISPYTINTEQTMAEQNARNSYNSAMVVLSQEKLVAGYAFREPISDFIVCILEQLEERSNLRPEDMSGVIDINLKAEETVRRIDAIVSDQ